MYDYQADIRNPLRTHTVILYRYLLPIAILVNNAFKTVQQSAKDKEDICRRADARQRYLTQDFTLCWTGLRCVILEDRYRYYLSRSSRFFFSSIILSRSSAACSKLSPAAAARICFSTLAMSLVSSL